MSNKKYGELDSSNHSTNSTASSSGDDSAVHNTAAKKVHKAKRSTAKYAPIAGDTDELSNAALVAKLIPELQFVGEAGSSLREFTKDFKWLVAILDLADNEHAPKLRANILAYLDGSLEQKVEPEIRKINFRVYCHSLVNSVKNAKVIDSRKIVAELSRDSAKSSNYSSVSTSEDNLREAVPQNIKSPPVTNFGNLLSKALFGSAGNSVFKKNQKPQDGASTHDLLGNRDHKR
jgi:hypothetical protein